jgi:hypothetical protein
MAMVGAERACLTVEQVVMAVSTSCFAGSKPPCDSVSDLF